MSASFPVQEGRAVNVPASALPSELCMASGCKARWISAILSHEVSGDLQQAIFGFGKPSNYDEWKTHPRLLAVCKRHYRMIKHKDGVVLGYRKVNGKTVAYVKETYI